MQTHTFNYDKVKASITRDKSRLFLRIFEKYNPDNTLLEKPLTSIKVDYDEIENKLIVRDKY